MRAWILVLAVLATFQAIVQVASTDSSMGGLTSSGSSSVSAKKSKHHRQRTSESWSSPTLSFAAIVAERGPEFDLLNSNNIVLNSDNVKHPSHEEASVVNSVEQHQLQLLVPTNSSTSLSSSSPSANNAVVNTKSSSSIRSNNINNHNSNSDESNRNNISNTSGNSNLINSNQIASGEIPKRRFSKRNPAGKGHRRRRLQRLWREQQQNLLLESNSVQQQSEQQDESARKSSNELNEEVVSQEDEEDVQQQEEEEQRERVKPDPETLVTIEKNLLTLFGFKKRPKIDRSKVVIPEAMRRMYAETTGMELDLPDLPKPQVRAHQTANTVRSFTHEESKIDHRFVHHHRFRLHFNTSNIPADELLKAAELVLSRDAVPDADRVRHRVQVYDIVRPGVKGKREPSFLLIDTKVVKVNTTENLILDVTPAMERWQREPKHNHGLLVHVSTVGRRGLKRMSSSSNSSTGEEEKKESNVTLDSPVHHHVRLRRSVQDTEEAWAHKQPLLFAYSDDKRHRQSRAAKEANSGGSGGGGKGNGRQRNRTKKKPRGICQRHPLWVDFEDVGWNDWIVAPRGYDAFYCKGECRIPMADHLNATNHAVVQSLVNSINGQLAPRACCVPTQLTTISLLYLDDQNKLVLKKYQDMAVVGCGCR